MDKLTTIHMRVGRSGIVVKYRTVADCEALTQKLGTIEHQTEDLISLICDNICRFAGEASPDKFESYCKDCPVTKMAEIIGV